MNFDGIESSKNAMKDLSVKKIETWSFGYGLIFCALIILNSF